MQYQQQQRSHESLLVVMLQGRNVVRMMFVIALTSLLLLSSTLTSIYNDKYTFCCNAYVAVTLTCRHFSYHNQRRQRNVLMVRERTSIDIDDPLHEIVSEVSVGDNKRRQALLTIMIPITAMMILQPSSLVAVAAAAAETATPKKDLKEEYRQGTAALGMSDDDPMAPVPREAYVKLPSGVIYADVVKPKVSNNEVAKIGSKVNIQWVLRRSNGYFVDSSQVNDGIPFVFTVGDASAAIVGLDEGIRGMQVGGVRRLLIPPSLAYVQGVNDGLPGPIPVGYGPRQQIRRIQNVRKDVPGEYIYLEIQLTRLR